jgi:hypothetical protein
MGRASLYTAAQHQSAGERGHRRRASDALGMSQRAGARQV